MRAFLRSLLRLIVGLLFRVKVRGAKAAFEQAPLLIVANHESFLDGLLLGLFLPTHPVFVVHTWVASNFWFGLGLRLVDHVVVDPTKPMGMKRVIKELESKRPVLVFPEGRITLTGGLMKIYDGPAFAAAKTGAFIAPVRLSGPRHSLFSRLSGLTKRRLFPPITLTMLPPQRIAMPSGGRSKERRRAASEALRRIMQEMLFASQPSATLFTALCDAASLHGRWRPRLADVRQQKASCHDLLKMALMLPRLLERAGGPFASGQRIGLLLPNLLPALGLLLGLGARAWTPAMLNYTAGQAGLRAACLAAEISLIVTSRAFIEQARLSSLLEGLAGVRIVYLEDLRQQLRLTDKLWLMAFALWFPRRVAQQPNPEQPAVVLFTSGSEGRPKGVVLSHRAILANIHQIRAVIDFTNKDTFLSALPLFHSFGLTAGALLPLMEGCGLFLYPSPLHYRVIPELAYDRNCTILLGTSTFLGNYAKFAHPYDFYRMRYVVSGAEKVQEEVRRIWFEKFGLRLFEGYGVTETAPVLAVNTPMAYRSGTVGKLLPGVECRLTPVEGLDAGGVLHVRCPNLMSGYLRVEAPGRLEAPASSLGAGWYDTGDVVELDDEGFVRIIGRVKRFAKIAGEMVSLEVAEGLAVAVSPAASHAVVAVADAQKGESLILFTTDKGLSREALISQARQVGAAELAIPRRLHVVEQLPLLGTGKTDYVGLKELALKQEKNNG